MKAVDALAEQQPDTVWLDLLNLMPDGDWPQPACEDSSRLQVIWQACGKGLRGKPLAKLGWADKAFADLLLGGCKFDSQAAMLKRAKHRK
jgi:hypothetical protein